MEGLDRKKRKMMTRPPGPPVFFRSFVYLSVDLGRSFFWIAWMGPSLYLERHLALFFFSLEQIGRASCRERVYVLV